MQGLTSDHIVPLRVYFLIAGALFVLLVLTVGVALVDLGPLNIVLALGVAVAKAILVVLFFMHVKYSSRLVKLFAAGGFLWLVILMLLTVSDFWSR